MTWCDTKIAIRSKRIGRSSLPSFSILHTHHVFFDSFPFWKETFVTEVVSSKPRAALAGSCPGLCSVGGAAANSALIPPARSSRGSAPHLWSLPFLPVPLQTFAEFSLASAQNTQHLYRKGGNLHPKHRDTVYTVQSLKWLLPSGSAEHSFHSSTSIFQ